MILLNREKTFLVKFFTLFQWGDISGASCNPIPALSAIFHKNSKKMAGVALWQYFATVLFVAGKGYMGKKDIVDRPYFSEGGIADV